jgi:hypothetical protein
MAESYYKYLTIPLNSLEIIRSENAAEYYKEEVNNVDSLLKKGARFRPIVDSYESYIVLQPKIGQRGLPKLFGGDELAAVNKLLVFKNEFAEWKERSFDILLQIQIAQCKALIKYKYFLEGKLSHLSSKKSSHKSAVKVFNWRGDIKQLKTLYKELIDGGFIICESFAVFKLLFNGFIQEKTNQYQRFLYYTWLSNCGKKNLLLRLMRITKYLYYKNCLRVLMEKN